MASFKCFFFYFCFLPEYQNRTIFLLTEIRSLLRKVYERGSQSIDENEEFEFDQLDTLEQLDELEEKLKDSQFKKSLVSHRHKFELK